MATAATAATAVTEGDGDWEASLEAFWADGITDTDPDMDMATMADIIPDTTVILRPSLREPGLWLRLWEFDPSQNPRVQLRPVVIALAAEFRFPPESRKPLCALNPPADRLLMGFGTWCVSSSGVYLLVRWSGSFLFVGFVHAELAHLAVEVGAVQAQ